MNAVNTRVREALRGNRGRKSGRKWHSPLASKQAATPAEHQVGSNNKLVAGLPCGPTSGVPRRLTGTAPRRRSVASQKCNLLRVGLSAVLLHRKLGPIPLRLPEALCRGHEHRRKLIAAHGKHDRSTWGAKRDSNP